VACPGNHMQSRVWADNHYDSRGRAGSLTVNYLLINYSH
jgi:hypothetical protein